RGGEAEAKGLEDEDMTGGFLPEGYEDAEEKATSLTSGFFPVVDEEEDTGSEEGGLEIDHGESSAREPAVEPGTSVMSTKPTRGAVPKAQSTRRRRRPNIPSSSEEDEDDELDSQSAGDE